LVAVLVIAANRGLLKKFYYHQNSMNAHMLRFEKRMADYVDTSSRLARLAEVTEPTVRKYANQGLLDFVLASNGTRLFRTGQAELVKKICATSIAKRGRGARPPTSTD
jgi:hypothetical protein